MPDPDKETVSGQIPAGFRLVEEGEVIPAGYETRVDMTLERTITNAPKAAAPPVPPIPPVPAKNTEKLDVNEMHQEEKGMLEVSWGEEKGGDDLFKGKTRTVADTPKLPPNQKGPDTPPASIEKFKFGISVVVMVIDFILSNILAKIAGEGEKPGSYTADKEGKETFEQSLCLLLDMKKDLIPTWLIVLLAFASAWGFQIMGAIKSRGQKSKPPSEKNMNEKDSLKPGLFVGKDDKVYRRYANGSVHPAKWNQDGTEKIIGAPTRYSRKAA